jgi:hypothetical protein
MPERHWWIVRRSRPRFHPTASVAAALVLGVAGMSPERAEAGAGPPCPASIVQLTSYSGAGPFSTDAMVYDSTFVDVWTAHVTFDRSLGRMSLSASSSGRMNASVRVVERFDVVGVPAGTPVAATMEFRLEGWSEETCGGAGCGVKLEGTLAAGEDSVTVDANQMGPGLGRRDLVSTLRLPVSFVAGSPITAEFFLDYATGPGGSGAGASASGSFGVSGLPAGVRAIACWGGDVTPLRRVSWGKVKQSYH